MLYKIKDMRFSRKSFTLYEVLFVIVVMGIVAAVVLPRFAKKSFINSLTLRRFASQITSDIRYTRQLAVTNADNYFIVFDFHRNEYSIYKGSISSENQVGEIKTIPSEINCSDTRRFEFSSLGACDYNGSGLLLSLDGGQYRISVEPPTGIVMLDKIS